MSEVRASVPIVLLGFQILMIDGFDMQAIGFVATDIASTWSVPISAFGVVFSAALAGSIPGAALAGFVANRIGLRATLALSLALFGLSTLAVVWIDRIYELAALRFIAGIGLGAAIPVAVSIIDDHSPPRIRAFFLTFVLCGQPIGAVAGSALCAPLVPIYGWQFAFVLGGVIPLLLIPGVLAFLGSRVATDVRPAEGTSRRASQAFTRLLGADLRAVTIPLWMSTFMASFCIYIIVNWLPVMMRSGGSSLQASIWTISLFNAGGVTGALCVAALVDRYGPSKIMPPVFGLAAISTLAFSLSASESVLWFAAALSGFFGYGGAVLLGPLAVSSYPVELRTLGVGWMLAVGRVGAAVGPLTAAFAIGHLFWFTTAASIVVMLCLLALTKGRTFSQLHPAH